MDGRIDAYQTADTLGKTQLDLILKVYDGAIAAFHAAAEAYKAGDNNNGYDRIVRARRFVTHLYTTLNPEAGGEIAENLGKLYAFVLSQSHLAEATHDPETLRECAAVLKNVREGWAELKAQGLSEAVPRRTSLAEVEPSPAGLVTTG